MWNEHNCKTVNLIGVDGAHLLYDSLQYNSTLTSLNTECEWNTMQKAKTLTMIW